jgi:hypothetical protein
VVTSFRDTFWVMGFAITLMGIVVKEGVEE